MIVVDTSVAFKWMVPEDDSAVAEVLIGTPMIAPDFLVLECGNAIWKRVRRNHADPLLVSPSLSIIEKFVELMPTAPLVWEALKIAQTLDHAIYDCVFLALARRENIALVTADGRFQRKVLAAELQIPVTLLADWQPAAG